MLYFILHLFLYHCTNTNHYYQSSPFLLISLYVLNSSNTTQCHKYILDVTKEMCSFFRRNHVSVYTHGSFIIYLYLYASSHKLYLTSLKELCIYKFWRKYLRIKIFNCSCVWHLYIFIMWTYFIGKKFC